MSDLSWMDFVLSGSMFTLMFAMGLTLATDDFRRIAGNPRTTVVGTLVQLVLMPVVGMGIANLLDLSPLMSTGLVVVSACPGGMFSNMYVHLARGNTALSITLTATATLVTLFSLPLWVQYALTLFTPGGAEPIDMPVLDTALQLGALTILPVAVGMAARHFWPALSHHERKIALPSVILIIIGGVSQGLERPDIPFEAFLEGLYAAGYFAVAAIIVGVSVPALFGISARDTVTIAVEMIVKNTLLGIVLVSQSMDFEALIPIFAFAAFQTPGGIALLVGWRVLERRGWFGERQNNEELPTR